MLNFSPLVTAHFVSAIIAIFAGAVVFLSRKGTPFHRTVASTYIVAMFATVLTVVPVEATTLRIGNTRFGFFHVFIVIGLISLSVGLAALWRWRQHGNPKDLKAHQMHFAYSYAGLLMAGFSQISTNPMWGLVQGGGTTQFWIVFGITNVAIYSVASYFVITRIQRRDPLRFLQ